MTERVRSGELKRERAFRLNEASILKDGGPRREIGTSAIRKEIRDTDADIDTVIDILVTHTWGVQLQDLV